MATRYCLRLCFNLLHYWLGEEFAPFPLAAKIGKHSAAWREYLLFDFQPSKLQTSNLQTFSQSVYIESSSPSFALKTRRAQARANGKCPGAPRTPVLCCSRFQCQLQHNVLIQGSVVVIRQFLIFINQTFLMVSVALVTMVD